MHAASQCRAAGARCALPRAGGGAAALGPVAGGAAGASEVPQRRHVSHVCAGSRWRAAPAAAAEGSLLAVGAVVFAGRALARRRPAGGSGACAAPEGALRRGRHVLLHAIDDSGGPLGAPSSSSGLDPQDWCAYYINLARRADRRERLFGTLGRASPALLRQIRRIDAVDGQSLSFDDDALRDVVDEQSLDRALHAHRRGAHTIVHDGGHMLHFDNHLTLGGIACAMSHRLALLRVAEHPTADWGLIIEDDVNLVVPRTEEVIARIIEGLPADWDAVFLGYHDTFGAAHPSALQDGGAAVDARLTAEGLADIRAKPMPEPLFGLFAWVVRKEAAKALVENAFPINGQVDWALSRYLVFERGRAYFVSPGDMVFFSPKSEVAEDSDIQTMLSASDMYDRYESLEGYFDQMWGMDAMLEEYVRRHCGDDEDAAARLVQSFAVDDEDGDLDYEAAWPHADWALPPCEAPPPDCPPTEWPDP